ncbi:extracellular solute-binding protein [Methyloprofundus sedimenti]|nr:extracellular solute-binding protein [Methyloprofundus sedimenti]
MLNPLHPVIKISLMLFFLLFVKAIYAAPVILKLWRHETGDQELNASIQAIKRFNAAQNQWHINYATLPQSSYTESITAAALAKQLPCILDVDQPTVANFAWAGHLLPLDKLIDKKTLNKLTQGAKSFYQGQLYSIGQFDVVLTLFARKSILQKLDIRIADMNQPYSADEFLHILRKLKNDNVVTYPLDINTLSKGEWIAYGFSPWLQSAGGDLINRKNFIQAEGILNGPKSMQAIHWYKTLFTEKLVERQTVDDQGFLQGRVIFHYTGSWSAKDYTDAFKDDLLIIPPIDFGNGPKVGSGSWQWGISRSCKHQEAAAAFLNFLLKPEEIAKFSDATGLVPVSDEAAALTQNYRQGDKWRKFYEYSKRYSVARPETPAYPIISSSFEKAMLDIRNGKDELDAIDAAVDDIEYNILRNRGYGFTTGE